MTPPLNTIYFYNKSCNLRCCHCWIDPRFESRNDEDLVFEEVKDLFIQGKSLGMSGVKLSGGEPLLLPYIVPLINFLRDEHINLIVETNGTLITEEIAIALREANAFVSVSLDGTTEAIHNLLRISSGSFKKTVDGIKTVVRQGITPQIIFSIHRGNQHDLPGMITFAESLGARSLKINLIHGIGRAENLATENELTSSKDFINLYTLYKDAGTDNFKVLFDIPSAFKKITDINNDGCNTCGVKGIIGVLSDGMVSICGIGNVKSDLCFGNLRTTSLSDIWEKSDVLQRIRDDIPAHLEGICGRCFLKGMCFGKCIANTYYATGSFTRGNLFCEEALQLGMFPEHRLL